MTREASGPQPLLREVQAVAHREASGPHSTDVWSGMAYRENAYQPPPLPKGDPIWWRAVERFGFPALTAAALAFGFVKYNDQVREDRKAEAAQYDRQLGLLLDAHKADRDVLRQAMERQNTLLEQLPGKMQEALSGAAPRLRSRRQ